MYTLSEGIIREQTWLSSLSDPYKTEIDWYEKKRNVGDAIMMARVKACCYFASGCFPCSKFFCLCFKVIFIDDGNQIKKEKKKSGMTITLTAMWLQRCCSYYRFVVRTVKSYFWREICHWLTIYQLLKVYHVHSRWTLELGKWMKIT